MIKTEIRNKINFPDIRLQEELEVIADKIIIQDIINGIKARKAVVGGRLPKNEPATILRKGHDNPLEETGTLLNSFKSRAQGKNKVVISIMGDRAKIGKYLQDGIDTKKGLKQYIFFGISKDAFRRSMDYVRKKVKEYTSGANKR
jgi:hypothetical protein